jgi:2'-5' RNA ligase
MVLMRTFVAISLPERLKEQLEALRGELRRCGADVRWVAPSSMHLTLKFLGEILPRDFGDIDEVLQKIAASAPPTGARVRGMGSFPHLRRPRVIWVGVEPDDDRLAALQASVEAGFQEIGFAREKRRFNPHLTVGRVRSGRGIDKLVAAVNANAAIDLGRLPIEVMTLYESDLTPRGAIYTALGTYRLRG